MEATKALGERSDYYYAHTKVGKKEFEPPRKITKDEGAALELKQNSGASKWNANNYHWEEKNLEGWVKITLEKSFLQLQCSFPLKGATFTPIAADLGEGYAALNLRKGKSILSFDFSVLFSFKVDYDKVEYCGSIEWPYKFNDENFVANGNFTVNPKDAVVECKPSDENVSNENVDRIMRRVKILKKGISKNIVPKMADSVLANFFEELSNKKE